LTIYDINLPIARCTLFVKQNWESNHRKLVPVGDKVGLTQSLIDQHVSCPEASVTLHSPNQRAVRGLNLIHHPCSFPPFQYLLLVLVISGFLGNRRLRAKTKDSRPVRYHDYTSLLLLRLRFKVQSLPHVDVPSSVLIYKPAPLAGAVIASSHFFLPHVQLHQT
jgi:hypothetical protein